MGQRHPKERLLKLEEARIAKFEYGICPSDCIQHYVPPNFPLEPDLNKTYVMDCVRTWKLIVMAATGRMAEYKRPGIVLFYDEFFYRLFQRDFTMEYVFPDVSYFYGKSYNGTTINNGSELALYLLDEALVALVTGEAFGDSNCIRISYAASEETLIEAMKRVKTALEKLK